MKQKIFTLPNILTMLRLPLALLIIWAFYYNAILAWGLLISAILLDWIDGYAARKLNQVSKLGAILDPLFDRIFVIILFTFFFIKLELPLFFLILFFTRDAFTVTAATIFLLTKIPKKVEIKARIFGKIVTDLQFATLILMMIGNTGLVMVGGSFVFLFSIIALVDYSLYLRKHIISR